MNLTASVTRLLTAHVGLSSELFGCGAVQRALETVLSSAEAAEFAGRTARLLQGAGEDWESVVDEIVVCETWFFRDREPFRLLASYVREEWEPANPAGPFRVLCIPCGTGEEPLSVAIALLEAGLGADRICIDAADVSDRALELARQGVYGKSSFREDAVFPEERYFLNSPEGQRVRAEVAALVHFEKGNLLDLSAYRQREPYHAVFCRNALIYFEESARRRVMTGLSELMPDGSLLFTGHTELVPFLEAGYKSIDHPQSFACCKGEPLRKRIQSANKPAARMNDRMKQPLKKPANSGELLPGRAGVAPALLTEPAGGWRSQERQSLQEAGQLADRGELEPAADVCRRILAGGSQDPEVYSLLGVISESGGKIDNAEDFFRKALFLDPNHYQSLVHMSLLCERRGDMHASGLYRARAGRIAGDKEHL